MEDEHKSVEELAEDDLEDDDISLMFLAIEDSSWRRAQKYNGGDRRWLKRRWWHQPDVFRCREWQLKKNRSIMVVAESD